MTEKTQETIGETLDRLTGTNYTEDDYMTEDEANKKLKEAVHQLSKAICLTKIARNKIEHVVDKTDWEIDAMYDIDDALKSLAYSIANLETLDTDLAYIDNF